MTQRWRDGRSTYRPAGEPIDPTRYEVAEIDDDTTAKAFVTQHHYSRKYPAACARVGLFEGAELVGVAVFSQPATQAVLDILPDGRAAGTELGRLVLLDRVPANGESWFLARAFTILRTRNNGRRFTGVLSCADPLQRRAADGTVVMPGHVGTIYQALNGIYTGRTRARSLWLLPSGQVFSERAISKIRGQERGWRSAVDELRAVGAGPVGIDPAARLAEWLPRLCTRVRHPGNHRYVWAIDKRLARVIPRYLADRGVPTNLPRPKNVEIAV